MEKRFSSIFALLPFIAAFGIILAIARILQAVRSIL